MKVIVLAGGYGTRLLPLTKHTPKQLLKINHKFIIDYAIDKIIELGIKEIFVVSNDKFYTQFQQRAKNHKYSSFIEVFNDHTKSNEDRLGAIGDIEYIIDKKQINDDLLVIGSDNIFKFGLQKAYQLFQKTNKTTIIAYDVKNLELAKKYGIITINSNYKVTNFIEKPDNPPSTLASICVYFYPKYIIPQIKTYLLEGKNKLDSDGYKKRKDSPGNLPVRLIQKDKVYAQIHQEHRYDIGSFESLKSAKEDYGEKNITIENLKKGIL